MRKTIKSLVKKVLNMYPARVCRREFQLQEFIRFNERPVEYSFVFRKISEIYPKTILDVGTGITSLPHLMQYCGPLVTAIDNVRDYWGADAFNRHYHVIDDNICDTSLKDQYDLITCISVLEHMEEPDAAIRNMLSLLKPHGHLILTFPYDEEEYVRNVYGLPGSCYGQDMPFTTQMYSREQLDRWLHDVHCDIVEQEYWQFWEGKYWTVGQQLLPPRQVAVNENHQLTCIHIQMRNHQG